MCLTLPRRARMCARSELIVKQRVPRECVTLAGICSFSERFRLDRYTRSLNSLNSLNSLYT